MRFAKSASAWLDLSAIEGSVFVAISLYRDYLVVGSSQHVETTGKWSIWVGVYWSSDDTRQSKVFNSLTDTFDTQEEAERFGLEMGKEWIEKQ
jgi:hypothetical protein